MKLKRIFASIAKISLVILQLQRNWVIWPNTLYWALAVGNRCHESVKLWVAFYYLLTVIWSVPGPSPAKWNWELIYCKFWHDGLSSLKHIIHMSYPLKRPRRWSCSTACWFAGVDRCKILRLGSATSGARRCQSVSSIWKIDLKIESILSGVYVMLQLKGFCHELSSKGGLLAHTWQLARIIGREHKVLASANPWSCKSDPIMRSLLGKAVIRSPANQIGYVLRGNEIMSNGKHAFP